MKVSVRTLKTVIRHVLFEASRFYDEWFLEELPVLIYGDKELYRVGQELGHGNEHIVYAYDDDAVIKFRPVYEQSPEGVEGMLNALRSSEMRVLDSGVLNDENDEPFALWYVQPKYEPLTSAEEQTIDDVVSGRTSIEEVDDAKLRTFLERYVVLPYDLAGNNVMKDHGEFVISDI